MKIVDAESLEFLHELTRDVVAASRVRPGEKVGDSPANSTRFTLIRPGGRACYPAMWIRDFSMALDSGFISPEETANHLRLIAEKQNGPAERHLKSGAIIPPYAIADHINFDGGAVFYPGTYSAGDDQGGEPFGIRPPTCDHYEFIHIAHHLFKTTGKVEPVMLEHLRGAFEVPEIDEARGGVVSASPATRAVGFGFYDTVYLTGSILFPSLLRIRAAREMAWLTRDQTYSEIADTLAAHIAPIFAMENTRWLCAATDVGNQPDVWGTLYALHLKVLPERARAAALQTIAQELNQIEYQGAVRHLPGQMTWQRIAPGVAKDTYQNGAYWHTPTGWLIEALGQVDSQLARDVFVRLINHLKEGDFRRGSSFNAPWECFGRDGKAAQNAVYLASVAAPLAVLRNV